MHVKLTREDFSWRHNSENGALVVVCNDRIYGEVIPWTDKKSGDLTGFTGKIVGPDGLLKEFMPSESFWTPLEQAKEEIVAEICRILGQVLDSGQPASSMTTPPKPDSDPKVGPSCDVGGAMKVMRWMMDMAGMGMAARREALTELLAEVNAASAGSQTS